MRGVRAGLTKLLREAASSHDDEWLAGVLRRDHFMAQSEYRRNSAKPAKVPHTAPDTLAEGEFNRYYCRAVCRRAMDENSRVVVYRAKEVDNPRLSSERMIG